jgi:terminase large subunit-like protein
LAIGRPFKGHTSVRVRFEYRPFPQTIALHQAFGRYRERVAVTGARGGKTTAGIADIRHRAITQPGFDYEDIDRGEPYSIFVGAPTYAMVNRVILPGILRSFPAAIIAKNYHHTDHLLRIYGQKGLTDIYFLTARFPEAWQGVKAYGVWLDEFALLKETMYDEARTRLMDRNGWLLLTSTPRGQNWVYDRIYKPRARRKDLFYTSWTTMENERLPETARAEIERHRETMPKKYFRRTYEASWDVFEGQVYEEWNDEVHVVKAEDFTFYIANKSVGKGKNVVRLKKIIAGVDWGSTKDHKGVILVLGLSTAGVWYVLEESVAPYAEVYAPILVRGRTLIEDSWVRRAKALHAKWRISQFYCDPARPENLRMFREADLPGVEAAINDVAAGIECVSQLVHVNEDALMKLEMSTRLQILNTCEVTIGEMRSYHWKEGRAREEPEKMMDDTMDALRYAVYTAAKRGLGDRPADFGFAS